MIDYNEFMAEHCEKCGLTGTYKCKLEIVDNKCKNFETYDEENPFVCFGGY